MFAAEEIFTGSLVVVRKYSGILDCRLGCKRWRIKWPALEFGIECEPKSTSDVELGLRVPNEDLQIIRTTDAIPLDIYFEYSSDEFVYIT